MSEAPILTEVRPGSTGPVAARPSPYLSWSPSLAGAVVAASTFFVLVTFASAIGLAVASVSPTWRDTSVGLVVLSGTWVVLSAVGSFALGGYIAGRMRSSWQTNADEIHFRDGVHGLVVWSLGIIIGVGLALASAATLAEPTAKTNSSITATTASGEPSFLTFELDRLFRSDRRPEAGDPAARAEAGRIIQTGLGRTGLATDDHNYLVRLVSAQAGLSAPEADQRVTQILSESRDAASKARRVAVIIGFILAAALAAAAAAAWEAALVGGSHRDQNIAPSMGFAWRQYRP